MKNSTISKNFLILCILLVCGHSFEVLAQKPSNINKFRFPKTTWTESLVSDNVTNFNAAPGSYEFSVEPGYSNLHGTWASEIGWDVATTLSPRLGLSTGFSTSGLHTVENRMQARQTNVELAIQYLFAGKYNKMWVASLKAKPPTWFSETPDLARGWVLEPSLLFAKEWMKHFSTRLRFSPGIEWNSTLFEPFGNMHIAAFWQGKYFGIGNEAGIYSGRNTQQLYVAPQVHFSARKIALSIGYQFSEEINDRWDRSNQRVILRMSYLWSRGY